MRAVDSVTGAPADTKDTISPTGRPRSTGDCPLWHVQISPGRGHQPIQRTPDQSVSWSFYEQTQLGFGPRIAHEHATSLTEFAFDLLDGGGERAQRFQRFFLPHLQGERELGKLDEPASQDGKRLAGG